MFVHSDANFPRYGLQNCFFFVAQNQRKHYNIWVTVKFIETCSEVTECLSLMLNLATEISFNCLDFIALKVLQKGISLSRLRFVYN
jgi:hypothetical protein